VNRAPVFREESMSFGAGGGYAEQSKQFQNNFEMTWPLSLLGSSDGIEVFSSLASGEYGPGYVYWVDPLYAKFNLFNRVWAAPGLIEQGWRNFGGEAPTFSDVGANSFAKPARKATWTIASAVDAVFGRAFTFIIPPGHTLHLGGSGSVTGTGSLRVKPVGAASAAIALSSDAAAPALTTTVSGSTYSSAIVYMTRTSAVASTVTLASLWAQILPTGTSPILSRHLPGNGTTGMIFAGGAMPENYLLADPPMSSMFAKLTEVEAWA